MCFNFIRIESLIQFLQNRRVLKYVKQIEFRQSKRFQIGVVLPIRVITNEYRTDVLIIISLYHNLYKVPLTGRYGTKLLNS